MLQFRRKCLLHVVCFRRCCPYCAYYSIVCYRFFHYFFHHFTRLYKTQELLYLSAQDLLELKQESRNQERQWMVQKDKLLRELDSVKEQMNIDQPERSKKVVLNVSNNAVSDNTHRQQQELQVSNFFLFSEIMILRYCVFKEHLYEDHKFVS